MRHAEGSTMSLWFWRNGSGEDIPRNIKTDRISDLTLLTPKWVVDAEKNSRQLTRSISTKILKGIDPLKMASSSAHHFRHNSRPEDWIASVFFPNPAGYHNYSYDSATRDSRHGAMEIQIYK
ncbi:hypothetical protein AFLA_006045 [Aspergillus flavus NRRL3357]|nr:hypothetical protein AFLA_006045 [Aspergillus flavus NRRL3357]